MNCGDVVVSQSTRDKNRPYMWPTRRKGVLGAGEVFLGSKRTVYDYLWIMYILGL